MTDFNIQADPEAINRWLAEAILNSTIGESIRTTAITKLGQWEFKQTVERAVSDLVGAEARKFVEEDEALRAQIAEAVKAAMTPDLLQQIASRAVAKLSNGY